MRDSHACRWYLKLGADGRTGRIKNERRSGLDRDLRVCGIGDREETARQVRKTTGRVLRPRANRKVLQEGWRNQLWQILLLGWNQAPYPEESGDLG